MKRLSEIIIPVLTAFLLQAFFSIFPVDSCASIDSVPSGGSPVGIALYNPTNSAIVANEGDNSVSIVNLLTKSITDTIPVGKNPIGVGVDSELGRAIVANKKDNTVSIIDLNTKTVISTLSVGKDPERVAVNKITHKAYVTNSKSDTLSVIDLSQGVVEDTLPVGENPKGIAVYSGGNKGVVTNEKSDDVYLLDFATNTVSTVLLTGKAPQSVAVDETTGKALVVNKGDKTITIIDLSSAGIIDSIALGENPEQVAVIPGQKKAIVTDSKLDRVTFIDLTLHQITGHISVSKDPQCVAASSSLAIVTHTKKNEISIIDIANTPYLTSASAGKNPKGLDINPNKNQAVIANEKDDTISVFQIGTLTVEKTIVVDKKPVAVAVNPLTDQALVLSADAATLSIIDLVGGTTLKTLPTAAGSQSIAFNPKTNAILVASEKEDKIEIFDLAAGSKISEIQVGKSPRGVAVDTGLNKGITANQKEDTISLIDLAAGTVTSTLGVGRNPTAVAVNSETHLAVVANSKDDTVSIVNLLTGTVSGSIPVGLDPVDVAFNPRTNHAITANRHGKNLTIIDVATSTVKETISVGENVKRVAVNPKNNRAVMTDEKSDNITVIDLSGNDTTPPAVTITSHQDREIVQATPITFSGTVVDTQPWLHLNEVSVKPENNLFSFPDIALTPGENTFTITADDPAGNISETSITIILNRRPIANAGPDQSVDERIPATLNGDASSDPDGQPLNYNWVQIAGTAVTLSSPTSPAPTFSTPEVSRAGETLLFELTVSDPMGWTDVDTVSISINNVNRPPVSDSQPAVATNEDETAPLVLTASDLDSDPLTYQILVQPANGILTGTSPNLAYEPNTNYNGQDFFTFQTSDGLDISNTSIVTITINPVNDPPVAIADTAVTDEDTPVITVNVLANDSDIEGDVLTISGFTQATNGLVTNNQNGTFTYSPNQDFNGTDSFTYTMTDGNGGKDTTNITVTVNPVNDPPVAVADTAVTDEDAPVTTVNVLANDSDVEGDLLTVRGFSQATNGVVTNNNNGTFTYSPNQDFNGTDSFTYTMTDGSVFTSTATVTITINPVNDQPVAAADTAVTDEDTPVITVNVLTNDSDVEGDLLTVSGFTQAANGVVTSNNNGTFTYSPNQDFNGTDSFTYTMTDDASMSTATVTITVNPVNDGPVAVADTAATDEDTPVTTGNVLANDSDVDGDILTVSGFTQATNGVMTNNNNGTFTYSPNHDFNGTDSFSYTMTDGSAYTNIATVTITINAVNDAPAASPDSVSTHEDTPVITVNVLANDSDVEGDLLTVSGFTQATNGVVTNNNNGTFIYSSNQDFNGTDSFTYTMTDGASMSTAIVTITVSPVNDGPVAVADTAATNEETPVTTVNVLANDFDVDGDILTVSGFTQAANGVVTNNNNGTFTYSSNQDFNGTDSFTYNITDGSAYTSTATVTITINPVNDPPVAIADTAVTDEDTPVITVNVLANDFDIDGDLIDISGFSQATNGVVTNNNNGTFTYSPNQDFNGTDSFTYTMTDGNGGTGTTDITVTVNPVNDPPVASDANIETGRNTSVTIPFSGGDPDGDQLTFSIASTPKHGQLSGPGNIIYTPEAGYFGPDSFTYRANDGQAQSVEATVSITVYAPVAVITTSLNSPSAQADATFVITGQDIVEYRYKLDTGIFSSPIAVSTPLALTGLAEGDHVLKVIGRNIQGFWQSESDAAVFSWTTDYTPPVPVIDTAAGFFSASFPVTLSTSEPATIYYTVDGSVPTPGAPATKEAVSMVNLQIFNTTTLTYYAVDQAGNASAIDSRTYTIDNQIPTVTMSSPDNGTILFSNQTTIVFAFADATGVDPNTVQITVNGQDVTPASTITADSLSYTPPTGLPEGKTVVYVRATDLAGNRAEKYFSFSVDTSPLTTTPSHQGGNILENLYLRLTSSRPGTVYYTTDGTQPVKGGPNTLSGTSGEIIILIDRSMTVLFYAEDIYGNIETPVKSVSFVFDTTPPGVTSTSISENEQVNSVRPLITINYSDLHSGIDPAKVRFWLNGFEKTSSAAITDSQLSYTPSYDLKDDINSFKILLYDFAGNNTSFVVNFRVDTVIPETVISPTGGRYNKIQTATLTANEPATIYYTVDGSVPDLYASSTTLSGPSPIPNIEIAADMTINYFAVDPAGNIENVKTADFLIDLTAPEAPTGLVGVFKDVEAVLSWNSRPETDIEGYNLYRKTAGTAFVKINQAIIPQQAGPITYHDLTAPQGTEVWYAATSVDYSANESGYSNTASGTCETKPPALIALQPQSGFMSNLSQMTVSGTTTDASSINFVTVNGQTATTMDGFKTWSLPLTLIEGENTITVSAEDEYGNRSQALITGTLDTTLPVTSSSHASGIYNAALYLTLTNSEPGATIYYTLDNSIPDPANSAVATATGSVVLPNIDTPTIVKFYSIDPAGNQEAMQTLDLTIAVQPPEIKNLVPFEGQVFSTTARPVLSAEFSSAIVQLNLAETVVTVDNTPVVAEASVTQQGFTYTPLADLAEGSHTLTLSIKDQAGNLAQETRNFSIETLPPATVSSHLSGWYVDPQQVTLTLNKPGDIYYTTDGSIPAPGLAGTLQKRDQVSLRISKDTVINYYGVDNVGRKEQLHTLDLRFDLTPPEITGTTPARGEIISSTQPVVEIFYTEPESGLDGVLSRADIDGVELVPGIDNGARVNFSTPFTLAEGPHTLTVTLGNQAGMQTRTQVSFAIDATGPVTNILPPPGDYSTDPGSSNYMPEGIAISFETNDPLSETFYTLDGSTPVIGNPDTHLYDLKPFVIHSDTTVKFFSADAYGNQEAIKTAQYNYSGVPAPVEVRMSYADSVISLAWPDQGVGVAGYNVYRVEVKPGWDGADAALFAQEWGVDSNNNQINFGRSPDPDNNTWDRGFMLNTGLVTTTAFQDTNLSPGMEYIYFVQAVGVNGAKGRLDPGAWRSTYFSTKAASTYASHNSGIFNTSIELALEASVPATIYFTTDGTNPDLGSANAPSPVTIPLSADTTVKFFSVRTDNGASENIRTNSYIFDYDRPAVSSFTPAAGSRHNTADLTVGATYSDSIAGIDLAQSQLRVDGRLLDGILTDSSFTYNQVWPEGDHEVRLDLIDKAGNSSTETVAFTVDLTRPVLSVSPAAGVYNTDLPVTIKANEAATVFYTLDGTQPVPGQGTTRQGASPLNLTLTGNITVTMFARDTAGNDGTTLSADYLIDKQPPEIISSPTFAGTQVATQGRPLDIIYVYGDSGSGIDVSAVRLLDGNGRDITAKAVVTGNTLTLTLDNPRDGDHAYTLALADDTGNELTVSLEFSVDSTIPTTVASVQGGNFGAPFTVDLECSEPATIYYSTDGYPPFIGAANTTAVTAPAIGINIASNTRLQFFAKDTAGNIESVREETYLFNALPEGPSNLTAYHNQTAAQVELGWNPVAGAPRGYHLYRVINAQDVSILNQSRTAGVAPPQRLRLTGSTASANTYNDTAITPGATYWYGVTVVDAKGIESKISALAQVSVTSATSAPSPADAAARAQAWLQSTQDEQGYWGDSANTRILATSQALNALKSANLDNAGIRKGLFWLRGQFADNNDYLARKILTLSNYGQNVDELVHRLISQGHISSTYIYGWGIQKRFGWDALDTVLGYQATGRTTRNISRYNAGGYYLRTNSSLKSADGCYGWVPGKEASIYVSSLVYKVIKATAAEYQWITSAQNVDGSFGNGLIDTAAALIWLDLEATAHTNAVNYLISQQLPNGSWSNDPYVTGLVLEALLGGQS